MTPADHPSTGPLPAAEPLVLRVRDQGELVAAVPAMLGFHPRESLVLMATGGRSGRRLGLTLRIDLPPPEHPDHAEHVELVAASAVRGLLLDDPAGAIGVVVDEGGPARGDPPHALLAHRLALALEERDVRVLALLWAERTAGGARWACYDACGCTGVVPDPAGTAFVAAAVAEGRVVHADRAALQALVAPGDPGRLRHREQQLLRTVDGELGDGAGSALVLDPAAGVAAVDAAIADAAAGRLALPDERVVALATALGITEVRDAALQRCTGPLAVAAEQLWAALARETPDPEAAAPAALLAVSALLRGDGALANVALDRAEQAWPGHLLARLVRGAAEAGLRPSRVRALLRESLGDGSGREMRGER